MGRASLRRSLTIGSTALGAASLVVCAVLIWSTAELRRLNQDTTANLDSVRLAEEAKIELLLLAREVDPIVVRDLEDHVVDDLRDARGQSTTSAESEAAETAIGSVQGYLDARRRNGGASGKPQDEAFSAVDELIAVDSRQAVQARKTARMWGRTARTLGGAMALLLIATTGMFLWWLRYRAFLPVLELGDDLRRIARGERDVRARTNMPAEFREIAERFNEMSSALASQREAQMTSLAAIAHDLRNPLSAMSASVATVRDGAPLPPEPTVRQLVERVRRQIGRLSRMVSDLLDTTKIEAGQLELRVERLDLSVVLRDSASLLEQASTRHTIVLALPPQPTFVRCDALRIEQVLTNLLSNALKYSPEGGDVGLTLRSDGGFAVVSVSDHGDGMSPEDQAQLFEPFRRVGHSSAIAPGVGLGLFVSRRIIEAHGGQIDVDSARGKGTTFRVFLPLSTDDAAPRDARATGATAAV